MLQAPINAEKRWIRLDATGKRKLRSKPRKGQFILDAVTVASRSLVECALTLTLALTLWPFFWYRRLEAL